MHQLNFHGFALLPHSKPDLFTSGRSFWGAYRKGWRALPDTICPYKDKRSGKHHSHATYSSAWRRFWKEGHDDKHTGKCRYLEEEK